MSESTYDELHTLLDSLTGGEHVKATWKNGKYTLAAEGPVYIDGTYCECSETLRWGGGAIEETLTSIEVTHTEDVTVTRDDEAALHALLDSLGDCEEVTAEWHNEFGTMVLTAAVMSDRDYMWVNGPVPFRLRCDDGSLEPALRSVTVHRNVVKRWERDGDE